MHIMHFYLLLYMRKSWLAALMFTTVCKYEFSCIKERTKKVSQLTLATRVLPFPGGPVNNIPQWCAPEDRYDCGYFIGHCTDNKIWIKIRQKQHIINTMQLQAATEKKQQLSHNMSFLFCTGKHYLLLKIL